MSTPQHNSMVTKLDLDFYNPKTRLSLRAMQDIITRAEALLTEPLPEPLRHRVTLIRSLALSRRSRIPQWKQEDEQVFHEWNRHHGDGSIETPGLKAAEARYLKYDK